MESNKVLALVDADSLLYMSSKETLEESIAILNDKIENIFKETKATHYVLFLSYKKTFRHDIDSLYKANRKKSVSPLKWLKTLRAYLVENYSATQMNNVEADDLVAYWIKRFSQFPEVIMASPDKDLLQSISGKHFNYTYRIKEESKDKSKEELTEDDFNKGWWVETTEEEANYFKLWQLIAGDNGDNIKTIFPENAANWFVKNKMNFNDVVSAYILGFDYETPKPMKKYIKGLGTTVGLYELSKNYRLLHLLDCNSDFEREVGELPLLPNIQEVHVNSLETETLEF